MSKRKGTGYGFLLLAGLFLWNPIVGMVDVLPDLFGYLFLLLGLSVIADLQEGIDEVRERFRTIAWVAFGEIAAQLFIRFFLSATTSTEDLYKQNTPIWILLFSFVITILECYFLIPAYKQLFSGLGRLAERKTAAHFLQNPKGQLRYERMATFSVVFVIGKNLLSLLPEFAALSTYAFYQGGTAGTDWYAYIRAIRFLSLLPALILTVWWLVLWLRLFSTAKKDADFQAAIREDYEQKILPDRGLLLGRKLRLSFLFARIGAALLPTFMLLWEGFGKNQTYFGVELLPDFAAVAFLMASVCLLWRFERLRKLEIWIGAAAFSAGVAEWILSLSYYQRFAALDARYLPNAYQRMVFLTVAGILSSLLTAAFFCLFLLRIRRLINAERQAVSMKDFQGRMIWLFILLAGITAGKIADQILRPWTGWIWWIPLLLTVAFVLVLSSVLSEIATDLAVAYPSKKSSQVDAK